MSKKRAMLRAIEEDYQMEDGELDRYLETYECDTLELIRKTPTKLKTIGMLVDKKKFNTNDIELLRASIIEVLERDDDE